jgi:hydroxymethylpyrimidine pyrophosphatase-like HAD family hydrolase
MSIYVFDIDGTIAYAGQPVQANIGDALQALAVHHRLIFASARPVRDMLPMLPKSLHNALLIGCNGGMAYQHGQHLLTRYIASKLLKPLLARLNYLSIPYVLDGAWHYAVSQEHHPFHDYIRTLSCEEKTEETIIHTGVTKILILSEVHQDKVLASVKPDELSYHHHRFDQCYDLSPAGNNKYTTLSQFIGNQAYTAFGNDQNDFAMLHHAKQSVFLGEKDHFPSATHYLSREHLASFIQAMTRGDTAALKE